MSKSEVLGVYYKSFENVQENTEEWLQNDAYELGYQHGHRHY